MIPLFPKHFAAQKGEVFLRASEVYAKEGTLQHLPRQAARCGTPPFWLGNAKLIPEIPADFKEI